MLLNKQFTKHGEIVLACLPFCRRPPSAKPLSSVHMRWKAIGTCHITTEYIEQIGEILGGIKWVVTLVKPFNGKTETIFQKIKEGYLDKTQTAILQ